MMSNARGDHMRHLVKGDIYEETNIPVPINKFRAKFK